MHRVIGYYAKGKEEGTYFLSKQGGLIVMESEEALKQHLEEVENNKEFNFKKIRGHDVIKELNEDHPISLNRQTYTRFYSLAQKMNMEVPPPGEMPFEEKEKEGTPFVTFMTLPERS